MKHLYASIAVVGALVVSVTGIARAFSSGARPEAPMRAC
jgi:hypothetical protein